MGRRSAGRLCSTVWYHVPHGVPSGLDIIWWKNLETCRDVHQAVCDAVFGVFSSLLKCLPAEVRHLGVMGVGVATCRTIITHDKRGCSVLYRFQLLDVGPMLARRTQG